MTAKLYFWPGLPQGTKDKINGRHLRSSEKINPYRHGTLNYLIYLGMGASDAEAAINYYGDKKIRDSARLAYRMSRNISQDEVWALLPYIFESVDIIGKDELSRRMSATGQDPAEILEIHKKNTMQVANNPVIKLESIASAENHQH